MNTKHSTRRLDNLRFRSIRRDVRRDIKAAKKFRLPWWGVLCVIGGTVPIALLFYHFGRLNMALPALSVVAVLVLMLVFKWKLRRHPWFWITMTAIAALHVPLILLVPWTNRWVPAVVTSGIVTLDIYLIFWILAVVEKFLEGPKTTEA